MSRRDLSLFRKNKPVSESELDALIETSYSQTFAIEQDSKLSTGYIIIQEIFSLARELSIDSMPYSCVLNEAVNITRFLREYPDLLNDFLLMKMRRMRKLFLNPINDIELEYALANARFIKAVVERHSAALRICGLGRRYMDIRRIPKLTRLYSDVIYFKLSKNLLTDDDFQGHMKAIERAAYRHGFVKRRLLTKKDRVSGLCSNRQKWYVPSGEEVKRLLQKRIESSASLKKKVKPMDYALNA